MIVRWGLGELPGLRAELGIERPLLVAGTRWSAAPIDAAERWTEVPSSRIEEAAALAGDGVVALGGGSAVDLGKAISAAAGVPLVSIPTTYAGAEWTTFFGVRDPDRRMRGGGAGANLAGIVYDVALTLELPRGPTVGTAMNALAHCAEALYVVGHNEAADEHALAGARLVGEWLPRVVETPLDVEARTELLRGACHAGAALGGSGLALAHAMAQAIGGRYGLPHGALNAICLPAALSFNGEFVPGSLLRGEASKRAAELARLAGFDGLSGLGVPPGDFDDLAAAIVQRPGAKANPRPVAPDDVVALLREIA